MEIKVGQVMEFVQPADIDGRKIARGTRARVAHIMHEVKEERITLILLDRPEPEAIVVDRHVVGVHCRVVDG
ncbi:MAG: hypothetical protein LJE97_04250 [Betaproteobacteria bacterium]|jgi:hypothetical protein|nr:hypothetical protein [Betaproteobacteria bacterium]